MSSNLNIQQGDEVVYFQPDTEEVINGRPDHVAFVSKVSNDKKLDLTVYFYDGVPEVIKNIPHSDDKVPGKGYWEQKQ